MLILQLFLFVLGLIGAGLVSLGVWLLHPAAGYICIGMFCMFASFIYARQLAYQQAAAQPKKADS